MTGRPTRPLVLVIGGLDPSGAGLQADIETCFSLGAHALPVASALTVQTTRGLRRVVPVAPEIIREQITELVADVAPITACKIGMLPGREVALAVADALIALHPDTPVILDPVIRSSAGGRLMSEDLSQSLPEGLLSKVSLAKPNVSEARELGWFDADGTIRWKKGRPRYTLVTGADAAVDSIACHRLFDAGELCLEVRQVISPGLFHGTGCTLSSAIAAYCATGWDIPEAVRLGLEFTGESVIRGYSIGGGQCLPERRRGRED